MKSVTHTGRESCVGLGDPDDGTRPACGCWRVEGYGVNGVRFLPQASYFAASLDSVASIPLTLPLTKPKRWQYFSLSLMGPVLR
jgi:hypothetical protein